MRLGGILALQYADMSHQGAPVVDGFGVAGVAAGCGLYEVRDLMGHANVATTETYLRGAGNPDLARKLEGICIRQP